MINVFITNNYGTSLYNGIGSYIEQLVGCFVENEAINVHVIDFYSPADRFSLKCIGGVTHLCFPPFDYGVSLNRIGRVVDTFLRLYVPDSAENVFFFNYHYSGDAVFVSV